MKTLRVLLCCVALLGLVSCSANVKRHDPSSNFVYNGEKFSAVRVDLSTEAEKKQADNIKFNPTELKSNLERRLNADGLFGNDQPHTVQVTVKDIRVRSTFSAVMWGFMAGDDHIYGDVVILNGDNQPLHSFEVKASYALGGFAGGQDSMRMNWLYERFAEMVSKEIRGSPETQAKR
jgi:hypothetical protein